MGYILCWEPKLWWWKISLFICYSSIRVNFDKFEILWQKFKHKDLCYVNQLALAEHSHVLFFSFFFVLLFGVKSYFSNGWVTSCYMISSSEMQEYSNV